MDPRADKPQKSAQSKLFHDLKGQLNVIVLSKEQLVGHVPAELADLLDNIERAVQRAAVIIDEIKYTE